MKERIVNRIPRPYTLPMPCVPKVRFRERTPELSRYALRPTGAIHTRDGRRGTGDERRETRDERRETRDGRRETGDGRPCRNRRAPGPKIIGPGDGRPSAIRGREYVPWAPAKLKDGKFFSACGGRRKNFAQVGLRPILDFVESP